MSAHTRGCRRLAGASYVQIHVPELVDDTGVTWQRRIALWKRNKGVRGRD